MVGNLTAMLHSAAMPNSWMILVALAGSDERRESVRPTQRRMMGSVSDDKLCAACDEEEVGGEQSSVSGLGPRWCVHHPWRVLSLMRRTCTEPRDTISTRHDLDADKFCKITAHTRRVRVSVPLHRVPSTPMTPSSTRRMRAAFRSARLHSAAAQMCFTLGIVLLPESWIKARVTFSMSG